MGLRFDDVRLTQGEFTLAADWETGPGLTAVIGASGSGKSTLLAAVAGFLPVPEGRIEVDGRDIGGLPPARRPVAMLFQDNNLFPHLTLAQNVGLGLAPRLRLAAGNKSRVEDVLEQVGLGGLGGRRPGAVSGGQQSRAALARVLVQDRPVVLLDEPFSALGPGQRHEMLRLVKETLSGRVVLLVTHDPEETRDLAGKAVWIDEGVARPPSPLDALLDDPPEGLARYLGR